LQLAIPANIAIESSDSILKRINSSF
jgi:hypothetical protein